MKEESFEYLILGESGTLYVLCDFKGKVRKLTFWEKICLLF